MPTARSKDSLPPTARWGDVAPQGIADLGCPPDTGPVGSAIGDAAEEAHGDDSAAKDAHAADEESAGPASGQEVEDPAIAHDQPVDGPPVEGASDCGADQGGLNEIDELIRAAPPTPVLGGNGDRGDPDGADPPTPAVEQAVGAPEDRPGDLPD